MGLMELRLLGDECLLNAWGSRLSNELLLLRRSGQILSLLQQVSHGIIHRWSKWGSSWLWDNLLRGSLRLKCAQKGGWVESWTSLNWRTWIFDQLGLLYNSIVNCIKHCLHVSWLLLGLCDCLFQITIGEHVGDIVILLLDMHSTGGTKSKS